MGKALHVVIPKGMILTLDFKVSRIAAFLEGKGIDHCVVDINEPEILKEKLEQYIHLDGCMLFTFNNIGIDWEYEGGNIWKRFNIPVLSFIVDHPRYYSDVFLNPPCETYVICCDRNHVDFIHEYYPKVKGAFFIPQGGTEVDASVPASKRDIDVIYMGNCKKAVEEVAVPDFIADFSDEFYSYCITALLAEPGRITEEVIESFFDQKQMPVTKDQLLELNIYTAHYIEFIVRRRFQLAGMHALDNAGIHVEVYGGDWADPENPFSENIVVHNRVPNTELLKQLANSKISLCYLPWFKRGCTEKDADVLINGTLCVSEESEYLKERYSDGDNIIYFDIRNPEQMAADVKWLLENPQQLDVIASRGYYTAKLYDSWENRFIDICKLMNEIIGLE